MNFSSPTPWTEALQRLRSQDLLPTTLNTQQLSALPAAIRERAFFSARVTNADFIQRAKDLTAQAVDGKLNLPEFRLQMKSLLSSLDYRPAEGTQGGLQDLSSDPRLKVILDTNLQMAQGYGTFIADQNPDRLDAWPAQELFRLEPRTVPRDWVGRWSDAGGDFTADGRMVALKNDPIWEAISDFGLPYPPFAFGSGMWVRDISRTEAEEIGLLSRTDPAPDPAEVPGFNLGLEASAEGLSPDLQTALTTMGYTLSKGILTP
jgi:hypothetical protein